MAVVWLSCADAPNGFDLDDDRTRSFSHVRPRG